jgi:hypothetical protein
VHFTAHPLVITDDLVACAQAAGGTRPPAAFAWIIWHWDDIYLEWRQAMNGMSSGAIVTKGGIMSRSSCLRMWQRYMYRPL